LRVALCFPGQGSQSAGMAGTLIASPAAAPLLEVAGDAGLDLERALGGNDEELRPTEIAQPALLFVESVLSSALPEDLPVVAAAGHSVGEYAACAAAGALTPAEAMRLVIARGRAMAAMREGTMCALIGLDEAAAMEVCAAAADESGETVVVANINAPGQVVISGTRTSVETAARLARERGARRVIELNVSGAFHSPLMEEAANGFAGVLDSAGIKDARIPIVCNVDAAPVTAATELRPRLRRQLTSAVRWTDCVLQLVALGADVLAEVGPGSVLTGLARRIAPDVQAITVNSEADAHRLSQMVGSAR
jgi:[acyl-carrier-protein] S-malonyltransferase